MFNPELDGLGKVEPLKQHKKAVKEQVAAPPSSAMADALKRVLGAKGNASKPATPNSSSGPRM